MNKNTLLINKYKPTRFSDFIQATDPNPIIPFLMKQIEKNKILTMIVGEEETGKTTLLNTIIREYYDVPFSVYRSNVLYIHYLKEQGTSYYKNEVKYFCQTYCSIPGKKKTIVLDDLDFMTESNQTIFIRILDKYSKYVNFIASCKFLHKIFYGIQTRLMIVRLNRLSVTNLSVIANRIITEEGLLFEQDAVDSLIVVSKYKINRLINCIDKIKLFANKDGNINANIDTAPTPITKDMVYQLCANIQYTVYKKYFMLMIENNLKDAIETLYDLHDKGFSVIDILDNMFEYTKLITNVGDTGGDPDFILPITQLKVYEIIKIICKYITFFYNIHEDEIELALITNEIISTICI